MPEALLGGYPKGESFGTQLGYRLPEGREAFARYFANAIDVPGSETEALAGLSARTGASLVLGVIERDGSTRSEEHTSELQSLMRISYAVFCLKKKKESNTR